MRKLIIIGFIMGLFACVQSVEAQWTSLPFRLINTTTGDPLTGEAANVKFTKYPHTYPDDIISGVTVTEYGTQGNYVAKSFTTLQYAKMWLSGVVRADVDSLLTGNLLTYLPTVYVSIAGNQTITGEKVFNSSTVLKYPYVSTSSPLYTDYAHASFYASTLIWKGYVEALYGRLGSSNTWTGATNQFQAGLFHDLVTFEDVVTGMDYEMDNASDMYLWITPPSNTTLVWKRLGDSLYGIKPWYYDGTKMRMYSSGYKWYGRTATDAPIPLNTDQFQWTGDKLNLLSTAINSDSVKHKNMTVGKDTTWVVLGENVSKWRFLSLKKGFWATSGNVPDWLWYYKSFDESGSLVAADSFAVINDVVSVDVEATITLGTSNTKLDSVYLTAGLWSIDFGMVFHFSDASFGGAPTIQPDSVIMAATKTGGSSLFDNVTATQQYVSGVNYGRMGTLTWHANVQVTTPIWIYLNGRRKNTETALGHTSKHHYISALKVK